MSPHHLVVIVVLDHSRPTIR